MASEFGAVLDEQHLLARFQRRQCRAQTCGPAANHADIRKAVALFVAPLVVPSLDVDLPKSGDLADLCFRKRPHPLGFVEHLVVKPVREQRNGDLVDCRDVKLRRRPSIL